MRKANEIVDGPSRGATSEAARWLWDRIEAAQGAGAAP
jgi:hypothetical protein